METTVTRARRAWAAEDRDRGSALIITLMVLALVTALSATVATVTIGNLRSAWRAEQAGVALNAADAGLAQAVSYMRAEGVSGLACSPTCAGNPWGNEAAPATVTVPGATYEVWIEPVAPYPDNDPARYLVHSTATAGGDAARTVEAEVDVTANEVPHGIVARQVNGGGNVTVTDASIFSSGCVYQRSKINITGTDAAYGIPAAVHSSQIITNANGSGQFCSQTSKAIHDSGPCAAAYPYDQDRLGGNLASTSCSAAMAYPQYQQTDLDGDGQPDVDGSFLRDEAALRTLFGMNSPPFTEAELDQFRTIAQSQGNYWTSATGWTSPDESQAVVYFDLSGAEAGGTVDLNDITGFSRDAGLSATDPACPSKSLMIIIEGGNVKLNSNQQLAASVYLISSAPHGQVTKANGTAQFIGTLYSDTVNLTGTVDVALDECAMENISPALLSVDVASYREIDR